MAVFKCKMCGGNLEVQEGMTVCECEYCGSTQTVPQLDNEKKITLFTRANRLRIACEFDKASGVYESIVTEFPEEAEAYWGLVLCKYGIEYVDDPKTGKKIPTCHRSSFDSVMDDQNFDMVMEYSDATSRAVYREEAKAIEALRIAIIEVSSKEEPYDIFICYKETDAIGDRTIDSVIAQDVYDALTEKGYRVFFSRITLEDKLGQEYEPYIFAALNSAKIMLVFGTDYEYFNAVWVKNEWSRFLSLIEKGAKKTLIPCFKGVDAYDMPKEFARLQAQDMGKVGAIQDLLRGIAKIIGSKKSPATGGFSGMANPEASALSQRGNMALEDGDFKGAEDYFERALDVNPSDAYSYLGKFLAAYGLTSLDDFKDSLDEKVFILDENKEFKRAMHFADPALATHLKAIQDRNELSIERLRLIDVLRKLTVKKALREANKDFQEAIRVMAQGDDESYKQAITILNTLYTSKCINFSQYRAYKQELEGQYFALSYLHSKLEFCSLSEISSAAQSKGIKCTINALDALAEAGFLEKSDLGNDPKYSWPGADEERDRLLKEEQERLEKEKKQRAAYDDACEKVNNQIESEIAVAIVSIEEEYNYKLRGIQREIDEAVAEANRQRDSLEKQISDLQSRQSSLGFFKGKEKKALQAQIDEAQSSLYNIKSQYSIESSYQPQINQLNDEKQKAIDAATSDVRSKYVLPKLEDFSE